MVGVGPRSRRPAMSTEIPERQTPRRREAMCGNCGANLIGGQERWCSRRCKERAGQKRRDRTPAGRERGRARDARRRGRVLRRCRRCGICFECAGPGRPPSYCSDACRYPARPIRHCRCGAQLHSSRAQFCSPACRSEAARQARLETMPACGWCGKRVAGPRRRRFCSDTCADLRRRADGRGWTTVPGNGDTGGRKGRAYVKLREGVRERVRQGEGCHFYGRPGWEDCPGAIDLNLPRNHRNAFTAHHLVRLMEGGTPVPGAALMAPAHRGCNARDGLKAQNARRARRVPAQYQPTTALPMQVARPPGERTSRTW